MATSRDPPDDDGFSDSDQQWFDRLSGTPDALTGADAPAGADARREADALKLALQLEQLALDADPTLSAITSDEALQQQRLRLQARLAAEGLLQAHPQTPKETPPQTSPQTPQQAPSPVPPPAATGWRRGWGALRWHRAGGRPPAGVGWAWLPRWPMAAGLAASMLLVLVVLQPRWQEQDLDGPPLDPPPGLRGDDGVDKKTVPAPRRAAEAFAATLRAAGLRPGVYQQDKTFIVDIYLDAEQLAAAAPAFEGLGLKPRVGFSRIEFNRR